MSENNSSVSNQTTYAGIGEYWDNHELDASFFEGEDLAVEVDVKSNRFYFSFDNDLVKEVSEIARSEGVDRGSLLNQWIREKVEERRAA